MFGLNAVNGVIPFFTFNKVAFSITSLGAISIPGGDGYSVFSFSYVNPKIVYLVVSDVSDSHCKIGRWNFSNSTYTLLHDPKNDISTLGANCQGTMAVTSDDACFTLGLDGSSSKYAYVWCSVKGANGWGPGARWYNTTTATVSNDSSNGWPGASTGSMNTSFNFGMHGLGGDGKYVFAGFDAGNCTLGCGLGAPAWAIWEPLTLNFANACNLTGISACGAPNHSIQGHAILGTPAHYVIDSPVLNGGSSFDFALRTIDSTQTAFNLADSNRIDLFPTPRSSDRSGSDQHGTLNNISSSGQQPSIHIDISSGHDITAISRSGNVVTVTVDAGDGPMSLFPGTDRITINNITGAATSFNGNFLVASGNGSPTFTYAQTGPNESGTTSVTSTAVPDILLPYEREIYAVPNDVTHRGTIYRFAHTFGDSCASNFNCYGEVDISWDGCFALFNSDMKQTLGTDPSLSNGPRTDTWLLELPCGKRIIPISGNL